MDKLAIKKKLLKICVELQKKRLDILKASIDEAQQSANEYGPPKDRYDSYRMQLLRKKDMLSYQLQIANNEYVALEKIDLTKEYKKVEFGAIAITNEQKLFVSIGIGKINLGKEIYFAISPNVPIFNTIKGLKKDDDFSFNGKTSKIIDVF